MRDDQAVDVAIIGAGPAGLTAAYLLTKAGYSVTVIEKDPIYVGGISRTVEHEGFRFDIGGHRFFSKIKEVVDLWNEILPDDFIERPRMSRIYYEGKFYSYPLRAFEALRNLGIWRSALCMASYCARKAVPQEGREELRGLDDQPVRREALLDLLQDLHREGVGHGRATRFRPTGRRSASRASASAARCSTGSSARSASTSKPNDGMATKTLLESFRYPRKGPGMMWEAARDHVVAGGNHGADGPCAPAAAATTPTGRWRVAATSARRRDVIDQRARHVISSAPMRELVGRIHPLPQTLPQALDLKYRDFLTVALMIRSEDLFPDNWIYIHDPTA